MKLRNILLATCIMAGISNAVIADEQYTVRVPLKERLSNWDTASSIFSNWIDKGSHYNCLSWTPDSNAVDYGTGFLQSRSCSQNQERTETMRKFDKFSNSFSNIGTKTNSQTIAEAESRSGTGLRRNWASYTSIVSSWENDGVPHHVAEYSPAANNQTANFVQSRTFKQDQIRHEQLREKDSITNDVRNVGSPIAENQTLTESESRTIAVASSGWVNNGSAHSYSSWSPSQSSRANGDYFTQTRTHQQPKVMTYTMKSGSTVIKTNLSTKTDSISESRSVPGTRPLEWRWHEYKSRLSSCGGTPIRSSGRGSCSSKNATYKSCSRDYGAPGNNVYWSVTTKRCY